jgi:hypothetical protein
MRTFPVYFLENSKEIYVFCPDNFRDVSHAVFWKHIVAPQVANIVGVKLNSIINIPYCLKRARVHLKKGFVYYGEFQSPELLEALKKKTGLQNLRFLHDDHEKRLGYDVEVWNMLLTKVNDDIRLTVI